MNELDDARARVTRLQRLLRLEDWDISVEMVEGKTSPDSWGNVRIDALRRRALIKLTAEPDRHPSLYNFSPPSMENTLAHEMVEIVVDKIRDTDNEDKRTAQDWEVAINQLCEALDTLIRGSEASGEDDHT